jgi:hypothetical protein
MPEYYIFDKGVWKRRKTKERKGIISRMHSVFPSEGDKFYLRMMLLSKKGPNSYQDLRTVDGV